MDTLTHIVLGGCIGEIFVGRKIGKRALILGAIAQSIPDLDIIAGSWTSPSANLLAHRGFSHSFLFLLLVTPLLAWLADKWRRPHDVSFRTWCYFFATEILVHIFIDAFNAYGTGWLEPFNHVRFTFNILFVADPLFTIVPVIVFFWLLFRRTHRQRNFWAVITIGWCFFYLAVSLVNKLVVESDVRKIAARQNIVYHRHFTTPTPFNNMLWFVVLESDKGFYIGHRSVFDTRYNMPFYYFPRNESLLVPVKDMKDLIDLKRFSQGYYTVEKWGDTVVFNDLRFGQIIGWKNPEAHFTFHYFLRKAYSNDMVVQRGRFANWNKDAIKSMLKRIGGE
jgi:inner membrane protein